MTPIIEQNENNWNPTIEYLKTRRDENMRRSKEAKTESESSWFAGKADTYRHLAMMMELNK